jgi:hypothetical protein
MELNFDDYPGFQLKIQLPTNKESSHFFIFLQAPVASYLLPTSSVISFLGSLFYGEKESVAEVAPPEMVAAE